MGGTMTQKKNRERVVAEITTVHLIEFMREQGRSMDQQQALNFLNQDGHAYVMWKQMMHAAENYISSEIAQRRTTQTLSMV
jgi:hypothetical protein